MNINHVPICATSTFSCKFIYLGRKVIINMSFVGIKSCPLANDSFALCTNSIEWKFKPHDRSLQILIVSFRSVELADRFLLVSSWRIILIWNTISICLGRSEWTHVVSTLSSWKRLLRIVCCCFFYYGGWVTWLSFTFFVHLYLLTHSSLKIWAKYPAHVGINTP